MFVLFSADSALIKFSFPKKPDSQSYRLAAQLKIKPCDVAFLPPLTELPLAFFAALPELLQDLQSRAHAAAPASSSSSLLSPCVFILLYYSLRSPCFPMLVWSVNSSCSTTAAAPGLFVKTCSVVLRNVPLQSTDRDKAYS